MNNFSQRLRSSFLTPAAVAGALFFGLLNAPSAGHSSDEESPWYQWRGSDRSSIAEPTESQTDWVERPRRVWEIAVGEGQSSPVYRDLIFVFDRLEGRERAAAYRFEDGELVWEVSEAVKFRPGMGGGSFGAGPKATPVALDGKLVTYGVTSILTVRNAETGEVVWRRDLKEEEDDPVLYWGNSMSPIVSGGNVVVQFGDEKKGGLRAFDLETGDPSWKISGEGSSYSSPTSMLYEGNEILVFMTWEGLLGLSSAGKVLFREALPMSFSRQNTASPTGSNGVIAYTGEKRPLTAVKIAGTGENLKLERLWSRDDLPHDLASPVAFDDRVCGFTTRNRGQLFCVDLKTGEEIWRGPGRSGDFASLTVAGESLLALAEDGKLFVLGRAGQSWQPLAGHQLMNSSTHSLPAVVGNSLIVKGKKSLARFDF